MLSFKYNFSSSISMFVFVIEGKRKHFFLVSHNSLSGSDSSVRFKSKFARSGVSGVKSFFSALFIRISHR